MATSLERPRLAAALATPGLLLLGPAGSGKTVLASQLCATATRSAWLRLTPGRAGADDLIALAAASLDAPPPPQGAGLVDLAGYLVELLDEPCVLVVDDYGQAVGQECDPLLAEAMPLLSPGSTIVVCSRTRPIGLLGRTAGGIVRNLEAPELAFTPGEAEALFTMVGADPAGAAQACAELHGWAAGIAFAAVTGYPAQPAALADLVAGALGDGNLVAALAVLPYLTGPLAERLGVGDAATLGELGERSMLVLEQGGEWRLSPVAAQAIASGVDEQDQARWRRAASDVLASLDPATAVELLMDDGAFVEAIALAGEHLSAIPPDRAVPWLYRLPAELRRQFPPVLAEGRATVDLDAATAAAEEAVLRAEDDTARREALFGLGSAHLHAGRLGEAAAALEAAGGPGSPRQLAARTTGWLAAARWWAGDLAGALAAATLGDGDPVAAWVEAEVRLARHEQAGPPSVPCLGGAAVVAKAFLAHGERSRGRPLADAAYQQAAEEGGFSLAVAGPVQAWYLLTDGDLEAASAVADLVNRRIARHDAFASIHVWLVRLAVARARSDRSAAEEAARRIARLRALGFAPVETQARELLAPLAASPTEGLQVDLLGTLRLRVDGREVSTTWRSLKALEVLVYLAVRAERGAQREEVIEAVWPDREPDKGRMLLRAGLSEIRRRLEPARQTGEPSRFVTTSGDRLRLVADIDAAAAASDARDGRAAEGFNRFRGDALDDLPYAEWAFDERRALSSLRSKLADQLARDERADSAARVDALELLIAEQPWSGELYERLGAVHRSAGNEAGARSAAARRLGAGAG
jgi:DNA-binding SARP family transcriptional activator